ncbi:MAG: ComF family protein, partial [Desulfobulbia bacterium]
GLSARQRRLNVAGAFHVPDKWQKDFRDKNVLLIDNVITTGATVEACTRALMRSEAERVDILTPARVVRPQQLSY